MGCDGNSDGLRRTYERTTGLEDPSGDDESPAKVEASLDVLLAENDRLGAELTRQLQPTIEDAGLQGLPNVLK